MYFYLDLITMKNKFLLFLSNRYRHDLLDHGFGVQWMDDNDENNAINSKHSVISVRSVFNNNNIRLPPHTWRSLAKVNWIGFIEINRVSFY
jgi:hypothetical protein